MEGTFGQLLSWPERYTAKKQRAQMQCTAPSDYVAFAQPFGACEHMKHDDRSEHDGQADMPVQQVKAGEVPIAASYPPHARSKRKRDNKQCQYTVDRATIPFPR